MEDNEKLYFNGVNAQTGQYLVAPIDYTEAAELIKGVPDNSEVVTWLRRIWRTLSQPHLGLPLDVDPAVVKQAGWAIVFHKDEEATVKAALQPLIEHRLQRIANPGKVKVLEYRDGESRAQWLARHGVGAGNVEPTKVPYYLLLIGGPERIPFSLCHQLNVEYAAGCLHFESVGEYEQYARSVIDYETSQTIPNAKEMVFFASRHAADRATQLSADHLINPLADGSVLGFEKKKIWGDAATKAALIDTLVATSGKPPALLFTATHGVAWPSSDPRQPAMQGALLCQDWPAFTPVRPEHYVAAADLPGTTRVHGMITFHFACYGAGTPSHDRFIHKPGQPPLAIAEKSFLAALPKALLAHPNGGTLACIGHVERAWGYSIMTPKAGPQLLPFQNALGRIAKGQPVGHAMRDFSERYAALSTSLSSMLEQCGFGTYVSERELASAWIERNDAEGYLVLGDPAVCLRVEDM
jgi:hypothetical protein